MKGPNPRELDACIEQALRGAHVAWPVPLVGVLARGQARQHLRHSCPRQREPRATVGELWLPLPLDDALEVRRREEGVAEIVRLGGVVPGKRGLFTELARVPDSAPSTRGPEKAALPSTAT